MVHNNVQNAFHPNLLFLSCGNNLLIVRDPSGVLVWSICVKTCSYFIYVTESLIVLLINIKKLYCMSLLTKYFFTKKKKKKIFF